MASKEAGWLRHASRTVEEQLACLDAIERKSTAEGLAEQLQKIQADELRIMGERRREAPQEFDRGEDEAMEDDEDDDSEDEDGDDGEDDDEEGDDDNMRD